MVDSKPKNAGWPDNLYWVSTAIVAAGLAAAAAVWSFTRYEERAALTQYAETSKAEAVAAAAKVETQLSYIYTNLRTLAALPSVRKIARHGENLNADSLQTFQQIYNNLANTVAVSEVYIVPASIDPDRIDPATGQLEQPILMFDHLITGNDRGSRSDASANSEIEIQEYHQYRDQFTWFQTHYPATASIKGLDVPMLSGPEITICDNSVFDITGAEADRRGITFAVPFYGEDGVLKGSVAAILRSTAMQEMLPDGNYALLNTAYGYASPLTTGGQARESANWAVIGQADPDLIFSTVETLKTPDGRGRWQVWAGFPDQRILGGARFGSLQVMEWGAYGVDLLVVLAALGYFLLASRNRQLKHRIVIGRSETLAKLTETVSHELRNPLGAIRNFLFLLRQHAGGDAKSASLIERAERNVVRCDQIIADLLEFTRTTTLHPSRTNLNDWLKGVVDDQAFPAGISAKLEPGLTPLFASIDANRFTRVIRNLLNNATQAISAAERPGQIVLRTRRVDGQALIEVEDDGPGIAREVLPHIFEPLFTTKGFGAGLGLPIAKSLAEQHGGGISVESEPGRSTRFAVWLPAA